MDEEFRRFLRSGGRSEKAARRIMAYVAEYENFLREQRSVALCEAGGEDLEAFVAWVEQRPKASAKGYLWGIVYYYQYSSNEEMGRLAGILREQRIERKPFPLKEFRGSTPNMWRNWRRWEYGMSRRCWRPGGPKANERHFRSRAEWLAMLF